MRPSRRGRAARRHARRGVPKGVVCPRVLAIGLSLASLLGAARARADPDETERRLKVLSIDAVLRERIHGGIDRAVGFLGTRQSADGSIGRRDRHQLGVTALGALALRHAGTGPGRAAAARARAFLFPRETTTRPGLTANVYHAGLALLFLHADGAGEGHARRLARGLVTSQDTKSGWWAYDGPGAGTEVPKSEVDVPNLSTSQFAALGLWSARRVGEIGDAAAWRAHLSSLLDVPTPDGSWPYEPVRWNANAQKWGPRTYPNGTAMGLADLVLAVAALGPDDPLVRRRSADVDSVREAALRALERQAPWVLMGLTEWPFYSLFALEKACVFLGIERIGDVAWYRRGAERLLDFQAADGGWGERSWRRGVPDPQAESDVVDTAFGLLFLLRVSEAYRPVTPSEIDAPVVTSAAERPVHEPPPAPGPPTVRFSEARAILAALQAALRSPGASNREILGLLEALEAARDRMVPDPGLESPFPALRRRWRQEAGEAALDAFALARPARERGRNGREGVNLRAAQVLAGLDPALAPRVRLVLDAVHVRGPLPAGPEVLGAAFDALAALGGADDVRWLVREFLDSDARPERARRTERLLRALARFRDLPGAVRLDVTERILRTFEPVETGHDAFGWGASATNGGPLASPATFYYWETVRYDAVRALLALTRDPVLGEVPRGTDGRPLDTIAKAREWLRDHDTVSKPPWRDR